MYQISRARAKRLTMTEILSFEVQLVLSRATYPFFINLQEITFFVDDFFLTKFTANRNSIIEVHVINTCIQSLL